jgi:hypothetical protein
MGLSDQIRPAGVEAIGEPVQEAGNRVWRTLP